MTTNSTKYFCKRGAVSARFILVDTPLRGEYYYDGEHGKYYFGARYFDPFFGMWMSPDPAAVFFREVYAPLKWRDFIEKDILQRSNVEAVLLKHSFRASAQFANPYTYGGDPLNYVDPNGEAVHILVGAIIGAVVGTVNGVIQCASAGGGSCGKSVGVGFVEGAAVGGGAGAWGSGALASMSGGFAGGVTGSALNGGEGWDILKGGLMGAGMGAISYAATVHVKAKASYEQYEDQDPMKFFSKEALDEVYDRQLAISEKDGAFWDKQEFHIINDSQGERVGLNRYNIDSDNTSIPGPIDSDAKIIQTHDVNADFREPSPGDIKSLNRQIISKEFRAFMLDTKTSTIYEYNQSGTKNVTYNFDRNYNRDVYYKNSWGRNFSW
jgi:hypothetical protein